GPGSEPPPKPPRS
nr:Chain C, Proline rich motif from MICAL1 [Homo sapiens]